MARGTCGCAPRYLPLWVYRLLTAHNRENMGVSLGQLSFPGARIRNLLATWRHGWVWCDVLAPLLLTRLALTAVGLYASSGNVFATWANWDAGWYLSIAQHGYNAQNDINQTNAAFAPALPLLMRLVSLPLGPFATNSAVMACGFVVANVALVIALVYLVKLVRLDFDAPTASRAALYALVFPTTLFLSAVYPHALFLAGAIGAFYYARQGRWWLAGALGALAALSRVQGCVIVLPLALEYLMAHGFSLQRLQRRRAKHCSGGQGFAAFAGERARGPGQLAQRRADPSEPGACTESSTAPDVGPAPRPGSTGTDSTHARANRRRSGQAHIQERQHRQPATQLQRSVLESRDLLALLLPVVAVLAFGCVLWLQVGDPLAMLGAGSEWQRHFGAPWTPLLAYLHEPLGAHGSNTSPLDLAFTLLFIALVALSWVRVRAPLALFATLLLLVSLASGLLVSSMRYGLELFPVFVVLAISGRFRAFHYAYLAVAGYMALRFMSQFAESLWVA